MTATGGTAGGNAAGGDGGPVAGRPASERSGSRRRRALGWSTAAGLVLGLAAGAFVVHALTSEWSRARDALAGAAWGWVVAGFLLATAAMVTMGRGWRSTLRLLGDDRRPAQVTAWYFVGEAGKYLPGGLWSVLGRGELARRAGVRRSLAYASVALSLAALYVAATFVAVGLLPFALTGGATPSPWMLFLLALPVGLLGLHPDVLTRGARLARRLTRRELDVDIPRWSDSVRLVARYLPTWFLVAGATLAVSRSLSADVAVPQILFAAVLSWVAGFLAIPVPAGAGVREAVFVATCGLPGAVAATVAVATRVLFIAVDAGGAALGAAMLARAARSADEELADAAPLESPDPAG